MILKTFLETPIVCSGFLTLIGKTMSILDWLLHRNSVEFMNNDVLNHREIAATFVN